MSVSAIASEVRRIWTEALGEPPETDDTDFFEAGGQSLGLIRLLAGVQDAYGLELPVHELFADGFTVASATAAIDRMLTSAPTRDESDALAAELEQLSDEEIRALLAADS